MSAAAHPGRTLALLAALFLGPLVVAFLLYYVSDWRPVGHTNHGTLIEPPRPLADAPGGALFRGKWSLVYVGAGSCDANCHKTLYFMGQTHMGLGRLYTQVQRVFLATTPCCGGPNLQREYPPLRIIDVAAAHSESLLARFPTTSRNRTIFVVDPFGNLMMRYNADAGPRGLLTDLKQLLAPLTGVG